MVTVPFYALQREETTIESELGYKLSWEEMPENQSSRIAVYKDQADINDKADWQAQHDWLLIAWRISVPCLPTGSAASTSARCPLQTASLRAIECRILRIDCDGRGRNEQQRVVVVGAGEGVDGNEAVGGAWGNVEELSCSRPEQSCVPIG
jgi:hypothetical protein